MPLSAGLFSRRRKDPPVPPPEPVAKPEPAPAPERRKWQYQTALRAIGHHADDAGLRSVSLMEVGGGFVLRAHAGPDPTQVSGVEITTEDMDGLILKNFTAAGRSDELAYRSPLCPTGYEDWFRALGLHLDENGFRTVAVAELTDGFAISFLRPAEGGGEEFGGLLLRKTEIQGLLDAAYRRRGTLDAPTEIPAPDKVASEHL
jgi:hypothetical protein